MTNTEKLHSANNLTGRRNVLVHCHIFKNAGSSLDVELSRNFSEHWMPFEGTSGQNILTFADMATLSEAEPRLAAISSHKVLPSTAYSWLHPLVFLRHPVDRAYSIYHFCRRDPAQPQHEIAATNDFAGFIEWSLTPESLGVVLRDYQTIHLSSAALRGSDIQKVRATKRDLGRALSLVRRLPTIGLTREFGRSCELINWVYRPLFPGLDLREAHENQSTEKLGTDDEAVERARSELGETLYGRLLEANRCDLELYAKAKLRFDHLVELGAVARRVSHPTERSDIIDRTLEEPWVAPPGAVAIGEVPCELRGQPGAVSVDRSSERMSGELERFDPLEQRGRIAYEHLHRYAICREMVTGRRVLDIACGTGYGSAMLAASAATVTGIDISPQAVRLARSRHTLANLTYMAADCYDLPFEAANFDAVVANEMIEHVADHDGLILEAKRVLADSGIFIVSSPNKSVYNQYKPPNRFHISEMEMDEFAALLRRHFRHVKLVGLRMALVSTGYPIDGGQPGANQAAARLYRGEFANDELPSVDNAEIDLTAPEYILAVCSDQPIPDSIDESSVFFSNQEDLWLEHERIMAWASGVHEEGEVLRADLRNAREEIERLSHLAEAAEQTRQELHQQLQYLQSANTTIVDLAARQSATAPMATTMATLFGRLAGHAVGVEDAALMAAALEVGETLAVQKRDLAELEKLNGKVAHLENQLEAAQSSRYELDLKLVRLESKAEIADERLVDVNRRLAEEVAGHAAAREQAQALQAQLVRTQEHCDDALARFHRENTDHAATQEKLSALQDELTRANADHQEALARLERDGADRQEFHVKAVENLEQEIAQTQRHRDDALARLDQENADHVATQEKLSALQDEWTRANADHQEALAQLEREIAQTQEHRDDALARLDHENTDHAATQEKLSALQDELTRANADHQEVLAQLERDAAGRQESHEEAVEYLKQEIAIASQARIDDLAQAQEATDQLLSVLRSDSAKELAEIRSKHDSLIDEQERLLIAAIQARNEVSSAADALARANASRQFAITHGRIRSSLLAAREEVRRYMSVASRERQERGFGDIAFDRVWLEAVNPDLGEVPLDRYLSDETLFGIDPHPLFSASFYLSSYPEVAAAGINPLRHYLQQGWRNSQDPHPYFANDWYLAKNPDVLAAGLNPLVHYLEHGWQEGRWPNPAFDPRAYLDRHPDVAAVGVEPLTHYRLWGPDEGRDLPVRGIGPHWRRYLPHQDRDVELLDYLLRRDPADEHVADAQALTPGEADGAATTKDYPPPLDDFWIEQPLRDHIIERYGESSLGLYWYLCSVMNRHQGDQSRFPASAECADMLDRLHDLAAAALVGPGEVPDASIVLPVYNNVLDTMLCLVTIFETRGEKTLEVIVADDGSSDATTTLIPAIGGAVRYLRQPQNYGFLGNCNEAAKLARGRHLILLNNDTLVLPYWLDSLLEPFDQLEKIGLTGSKLLNWDGTLQEAGGIFWQDGSAWNFGRGQGARDCGFNYLKDTDYCSGASIAIPLSLWRQLDGFDPLFTPAYCEDSDIAFRIRERGYRTLYQPFSEVIHHEGRSHGRDVGSGVKSYQVINQQKLLERWGAKLASEHYPNSINVFRARDRSGGKPHVLFIDHYVPQWDQDAGSRTIFQYIKLYQDLGFAVTFWPDNLWYDPQYTPALQKMGVEVIYGAHFQKNFDAFIRERSDLYETVFLSRPHVAAEYLDAIRQHSSARVLYYGHDLHYRRMTMHYELTGEGNLAAIAETREHELAVCRRCDVIFYPDPEEVALVREEVGGDRRFLANPVFVYNDEQIAQAHRRLPAIRANQRKSLLFVGGFSHTPNVEGIVWFVKEVMPLLEERYSDIRLQVAGSRPPQTVTSLERYNIDILGFVSDERLASLYRETALAIAPLRYGAGVKGKVIEAMANGVPMATTSIGAQGIGPGEAVLFLGDDPETLAREIARALDDRAEAECRAKAAIDFIASHYSSEHMRKLFLDVSLA